MTRRRWNSMSRIVALRNSLARCWSAKAISILPRRAATTSASPVTRRSCKARRAAPSATNSRRDNELNRSDDTNEFVAIALRHHDHRHKEQADERDQRTRERRDRIEPVIPFGLTVHAAHSAPPSDATFRRERRSLMRSGNSSPPAYDARHIDPDAG